MPSLTNPNIVSIVTGVPPRGHGISGNHMLDPLAVHRRTPLDLLYVSLTDYVQHKQPPGGETALGKSPAKHDLSGLAGGPRSHGGRHEQIVPLIVSEAVSDPVWSSGRPLRSRDLHAMLLNAPGSSRSSGDA
jgi:hypothetical protein